MSLVTVYDGYTDHPFGGGGDMTQQELNFNHKPTQAERVLDWMRLFGSINTIEAVQELFILRLSARIYELKQLGFDISDAPYSYKNKAGDTITVKKYWLTTPCPTMLTTQKGC